MANQIRAAFYTLARNYRTWVALGLVAIDRAYSAWRVTQGVTYGLQDSILPRQGARARLPLCRGERGRLRPARRGPALCVRHREGASGLRGSPRFLTVAALTLGLLAVTAALDVAAGALVPGASVIAASPRMCAPEARGRRRAHVPRDRRARLCRGHSEIARIATAGIVVVAFVALCLIALAVVPAGSPTPMGVTLSEILGFVLPLEGLSANVMFAPYAALMPLDFPRAFVVPLVWLAALLALVRGVMARRTV